MITPHTVTDAAAPTTIADTTASKKKPKKKPARTPAKAKAKTAKKASAKKPKAARARAPAAAKKKAPKAKTAQKSRTAPAKRAYARTGEHAFEVRPWRDPAEVKATLNAKEQKVYDALRGGKAHTLLELADRAFRHKPSVEKSKSWVRNSLRRLRDGKLVKRLDAGTYQRVA